MRIINDIITGLYFIHYAERQDRFLYTTYISGFGFCKPADEMSSNSNSGNTYGVTPYIYTEILPGKNIRRNPIYIPSVLLISIVPPFNDVPHDEHLALDILS